MNAWFSQHRAALVRAVRRLLASPLNTLLSLLVIALAMALPLAGYVLLDNLKSLAGHASGNQQISLFMADDASRKDSAEIESRLKQAVPGAWRFVPREEALKRLQDSEGMAEIVASLPKNPLPDAFIVEPGERSPEALEALRQTFSQWPKVAHVQLDSAWVKRFDAFVRLGRMVVALLAAVFCAGLLAVTFNTIRLQVLANAAEIEVARLIGATDAFIRRPFQYFGALQGAAGGLLAGGGIVLALRWLAPPIGELASLYGAQYALAGPHALDLVAVALFGALLGWLGAHLSVSLSLRQLG